VGFDFKDLARDPRFQVAAVAVAAVGGYVLYKRKKTTGSTSVGTSDTTTTAAGYNGAATLNTSGTDIANWLGQYSGSLQNQLDAYQQSLSDAITNLQAISPAGGTPAPGTGGTVSIGKPITDPAAHTRLTV